MNSAVSEMMEQSRAEHEAALATMQSLKTRAEWLKKKMGRFSASQAYRLMTYQGKDELPKGAITYVTEKAVESLITEPEETFQSEAMNRGNELEAEAMRAFMERTGLEVYNWGEDQSFIELGKNAGCTPDGLIGKDSGCEGKAPKSKTHLFYLQNLKDPESLKKHCADYYWQCQFSMFVTNRKEWYFFSFDPRYRNENHRLLTLKIPRNDSDIEDLKSRLKLAIELKNKVIRELNG